MEVDAVSAWDLRLSAKSELGIGYVRLETVAGMPRHFEMCSIFRLFSCLVAFDFDVSGK